MVFTADPRKISATAAASQLKKFAAPSGQGPMPNQDLNLSPGVSLCGGSGSESAM